MLAARETFVTIASIESPSSSRIPAACAPAEPPKKDSTNTSRRAGTARKKAAKEKQQR